MTAKCYSRLLFIGVAKQPGQQSRFRKGVIPTVVVGRWIESGFRAGSQSPQFVYDCMRMGGWYHIILLTVDYPHRHMGVFFYVCGIVAATDGECRGKES